MYTLKPLDFAVFPTVLLLTTLLRLSLNVASTRVVLLHGHTGADAAGKVIEAFGHFLVGGNFAVGLVVFAILVVINFVVITKGAGRIAEVSARFTLDAMPGKQMAIDADLNAGLIGEDEARRRRAEIASEADFYGAMDGASKFVRGDAIAGILILFINIVGGLAIGMLQHDMSLSAAANNYMLLAIGDGLVAQIPALVISTAAGLVVSRVGKGEQTRPAADRPADVAAAGAGHRCRRARHCRTRSRHAARRVPAACSRHGCDRAQASPAQACVGTCGCRHCRCRARAARSVLGGPAAGRRAGPRGRLPADSSGRHRTGRRAAAPDQGDPAQVRAGHRLPAACRAYPRQPGARAECVSHHAQGRADR